jgi:hypothetical protein
VADFLPEKSSYPKTSLFLSLTAVVPLDFITPIWKNYISTYCAPRHVRQAVRMQVHVTDCFFS